MVFKPLTKNAPNDAALSKEKAKEEQELFELMNSSNLPDVIKTTEERIRLIFDDSGSMGAIVPGSAEPALNPNFNQNKSRLDLAKEATVDYLKNCKPRVSAVEIDFLNAPMIPLTKNLPKVAVDLKRIKEDGGTPLYEHLGRLVDDHKEKKFTRALIFTDGEASPDYRRPRIFEELKAMRIPIDLILIGNKLESTLNPNEQNLKRTVEESGGTFLICKDAKAFKAKMKYFAPLLRHQLAAVASDDSFGS